MSVRSEGSVSVAVPESPLGTVLRRCSELTGLQCGAAYRLRGQEAQLDAHVGFGADEPLESFFGYRELLVEALRASGGRVMRLRSTGVDPLAVHAVHARAGQALMLLVPILGAGSPPGVLVLGTPLTPRRAPVGAASHTDRVSRYCYELSALSGLSGAQSRLIGLASAMHDVGKLTVPDELLRKPAALSPDERRQVELHADFGHRILRGDPDPLSVLAAEIAWTHHERWDGGGYPRGLRGAEIPLAGRIAAIADVFDALTSDRPYRRALSVAEAVELMQVGRATHFDPVLLDRFVCALPRLLHARERSIVPERRRAASA